MYAFNVLIAMAAATLVKADYANNNTFEFNADLCEIFTVVESPILVHGCYKTNTVLTFDDCTVPAHEKLRTPRHVCIPSSITLQPCLHEQTKPRLLPGLCE